jgi:hypothetical protein
MRLRGLTRCEYELAEELWNRVTSRGEFGSRRLGYGFEHGHLVAVTDALRRYRNATRLRRRLQRLLDASDAPSLGDLIFQYPALEAELQARRRTWRHPLRILYASKGDFSLGFAGRRVGLPRRRRARRKMRPALEYTSRRLVGGGEPSSETAVGEPRHPGGGGAESY